MDKELTQDYDRLRSWAKTLLNSIESNRPFIEQILTSSEPLPAGCPSRGSAAAMQFGDVTKALSEVQGACLDVHNKLVGKK